MAPTPIPCSIWPGSHAPRKSGFDPTRCMYHTRLPAQISAPTMMIIRWPCRSATRPSTAATTAATKAAGATARPGCNKCVAPHVVQEQHVGEQVAVEPRAGDKCQVLPAVNDRMRRKAGSISGAGWDLRTQHEPDERGRGG